MGLEIQKYSLIEYPRVNLSAATRVRARFLINTHYTKLYGASIRNENPRTMRVKILELESHLELYRRTLPHLHKSLVRQIADFERICALLEILR